MGDHRHLPLDAAARRHADDGDMPLRGAFLSCSAHWPISANLVRHIVRQHHNNGEVIRLSSVCLSPR